MKDFDKIADVEVTGWAKFGVMLYVKGLIGMLLVSILYLIDSDPGMPTNVFMFLMGVSLAAVIIGRWIMVRTFPQLR